MPVKVHLCCGTQHFRGWINVDVVPLGQEVIADLSQPWTFLEAGSVDHLFCKDGFEHQADHGHFLREASRVLRPGGILELWVPHFKNPSAYRITHTQFFSWSTFNVYPEPHDSVQDLRVIRNEIVIGHADTLLWKPFHWLINLIPKWYERLGYVSNVHVILQKHQSAPTVTDST